jgi:hypothetical protein
MDRKVKSKKERHIPANFPNDMSSLQPIETLVELNVVNVIVVTFRKQKLMFSWRKLELREPKGRSKLVPIQYFSLCPMVWYCDEPIRYNGENDSRLTSSS